MKMFKIYSLIFLFVGTLLFSCSKTGPQGPQGVQGEVGQQGIKGEKGDPGAANVMSKTFNAADITWAATTQFGTNYLSAALSLPQITDNIINNGMVLVYGSFFFGEKWTALPVSYYEGGVTKYFFFGTKTGSVTLRSSQSNNVTPIKPALNFRVLVVRGNALARKSVPPPDYNNYHAVCQYYGIQE